MTSPTPTQKVIQGRPRRASLLLRDGATVECGVFLNDGQSFAPYLGSRKGGWVNVIDAHWVRENETHNHAVLQADHILIAGSMDRDIPMYGATAGGVPREVEITIEDGSRVHGTLHLAEKQRLSDYLTTCGKFIPVLGATRDGMAGELGDVALNRYAVRVVHDATVFAHGTMEMAGEVAAAAAEATAAGRPSGAGPVNRDVVRHDSAAVEVITQGRDPDRRDGRPYLAPASATHPGAEEPAAAAPIALTPEQKRVADQLSRPWLVQLVARSQLLPPDPSALSAEPHLEEIWRGLAARNDMAEGELAVQVAAAFKLPAANLNHATAAALKVISEKVARKLGVLPLRTDGKQLALAISDPTSMDLEQQLGFVTRLHLQYEIAPPTDIRGAIDWYYGGNTPSA